MYAQVCFDNIALPTYVYARARSRARLGGPDTTITAITAITAITTITTITTIMTITTIDTITTITTISSAQRGNATGGKGS